MKVLVTVYRRAGNPVDLEVPATVPVRDLVSWLYRAFYGEDIRLRRVPNALKVRVAWDNVQERPNVELELRGHESLADRGIWDGAEVFLPAL